MDLLRGFKYKVLIWTVALSFLVILFGIFSHSLSAQPITPLVGGEGYTIDETFPDDNMASLVADKIGGGDINHLITQSDIDSSIIWDDLGFEFIGDITGVEYFVNLESLQLPFNNVTFLPPNFSNLTKLKYLDLSGNLLTELPSDFGNLSNLVNLWISENQITSLPASFSSLSNLERFEAEVNQITSLPTDFGNLSKLKVVLMYYNELTELPENIGNLTSLELLDVSDNFLNSVPSSLGSATNLKILRLNDNNLTQLPDTIVNLSNLEIFAIGSNQITSIPEDFDQLGSLAYFSFANNQLTSLPTDFKLLPALQTIRLFSNLLPSDVVDQLSEFTIDSSGSPQDKLKLNATDLSYNIKNQTDFDQIDYISFLALTSGRGLSANHTYLLDDARDENNNPVSISEYISNGVVIKSGKVLVKVRAAGIGLFPNSSDSAITDETIELNFEVTEYLLSFNLNGGEGTNPDIQRLLEGAKGTQVANPTRNGYTFKGWNSVQDGSGVEWNFETSVMPANDVTLYAQWTPIPPTIIVLPKTGTDSKVMGLSALLMGSGILILIFKKKKKAFHK